MAKATYRRKDLFETYGFIEQSMAIMVGIMASGRQTQHWSSNLELTSWDTTTRHTHTHTPVEAFLIQTTTPALLKMNWNLNINSLGWLTFSPHYSHKSCCPGWDTYSLPSTDSIEMELLGPRARTFARLLLYMLQNAFQKDAILLFGPLTVFSPTSYFNAPRLC